jgi:hypothetical protein
MLTLVLALTLRADVSPEQAAAIQHDAQKAQAEVAAKYGQKKSSELSSDERRDMIRDQASAERKVLDRHGVSAHDWSRSQALRSREEQAQVKKEAAAIAEKEKAAEEAKPKSPEAQPIAIQRGINEEHPVVLEERENPGGQIVVEKGLPPEVKEEKDLLSEHERLEAAGAAAAKAIAGHPSGARTSGGRRK